MRWLWSQGKLAKRLRLLGPSDALKKRSDYAKYICHGRGRVAGDGFVDFRRLFDGADGRGKTPPSPNKLQTAPGCRERLSPGAFDNTRASDL
jgi:hypothetical protein